MIFAFLSPSPTDAQFTAGFSLSVGEEYNDNIFFEKRKEHDFVTLITPTLTLLYQPAGQRGPTFNLNVSPTGLIFARHSEENNFGRNLTLDGGYTYEYSPRLSFYLGDTFQTRGTTRTTGIGESGTSQRTRIPFTPAAPGLPDAQRLGDFISNGETLDNFVSFQGRYLYAPNITITGGYTNGFTSFLDRGGNEISHSVNIRGGYQWGQQHNLHAGYTLRILKSREGENSVVHDLDIGDDYFSTTQIRLTPTLTLLASTGISLNTGNEGPRVANNTNITLTKLWEAASFDIGGRKGLTNSFGVSGLSDTTTLFSDFTIRFTERFSGRAGVEFALYDTDDVNFKTLQAQGGLQYAITNWLCSNLTYRHRRLYSGKGGENTDLQTRGNIYGNSVSLIFTVDFDLWPNLGLARRPGCGVTIPAVPQPSPRL